MLFWFLISIQIPHVLLNKFILFSIKFNRIEYLLTKNIKVENDEY